MIHQYQFPPVAVRRSIHERSIIRDCVIDGFKGRTGDGITDHLKS